MALEESIRRMGKDELTAPDLFDIMYMMTKTHMVKFHLGVNKPDSEFKSMTPENGSQVNPH